MSASEHEENGSIGLKQRSTPKLLSDITSDAISLIRTEGDVALEEVRTAAAAGTGALIIGVTAGVMAVLMLLFAGLAASDALSYLIPGWAAYLTVAAAFAMVTIMGTPVILKLIRTAEVTQGTAVRTAKEEFAWLKSLRKR